VAGGEKSRYKVIEQMGPGYTVKRICEVMQVSRSGYYRHLHVSKENRDQVTKERIQAIYNHREGIYGYRRIQMELERPYSQVVNHYPVPRV
jgi:putative transposase